MNNYGPDNQVVSSVKKLYAVVPAARVWFDNAAARRRDAGASTIERLMFVCNISRADAVSLARQLDEAGCAEFKNGRRGQKSRVEWLYSLISLGRAASGESEALDEIERGAEVIEDDETSQGLESASSASRGSMAGIIIEAKEALAKSLGIPSSSIEIIIRS